MELYSQSYFERHRADQEQPPVVIIPGLFGSTSNWRSFARQLSQRYPVIVVDQRNHGQSPQADSQSYADMVADLLEFVDQQGFERIIPCGHSMGGKVAMLFALMHPDRVARLVVMDIAPIEYAHSHAPFLRALMDLDLSQLSSRSAADRALRDDIPDTATRMFLLQSLTGSPGAYAWRLNLPVLHRDMPQIVGFPEALVEQHTSDVQSILIYGEDSTYVSAAHHALLRDYFSAMQFAGIAQAGHWLHVEQPKSVIAALLNFLDQEQPQ